MRSAPDDQWAPGPSFRSAHCQSYGMTSEKSDSLLMHAKHKEWLGTRDLVQVLLQFGVDYNKSHEKRLFLAIKFSAG